MFLARRALVRRLPFARAFTGPNGPNAPLDLDPAMQQLLRDTDLSLLRARKHKPRVIHELESEPVPIEENEEQMGVSVVGEEGQEEEEGGRRPERRSAAAVYGSYGVGAVVLPFELERSILNLIAGKSPYPTP